MCGIAGFIAQQPHPEALATLGRMAEQIQHRGPDDYGLYHDRHAFLGHRRLSIIDVAGGHQPMTNEDRSLWLIYNGEVFNHADIRPGLEQAGHRYTSRSDTETILHAYEEHGPDCLSLFRGMFAFVIWDPGRQTLFAARDRLGIKPFYYYWDGRLFAFASEIKALLEHPVISRAVEESALPEYLAFGYLSDERTLFRGIRKLMPGHHLLLDISGDTPVLRTRCYWDLQAPSNSAGRADETFWVSETRRRLEETVRMRLMSDVPLGMFLSGGVDSSAIAALMKRFFTGPVKTFSVGYREQEYSELSYAAEVARSIGTEHHEVLMGRNDFFDALPRLIWHEDEPITWPSSVSLYFVSRLASQQVKVVLTGEGSDEMFGGYVRYRWNLLNLEAARLYGAVPGVLRRWVEGQIASNPLLRASLRRKLAHTVLGRSGSVESLYLDNFYNAFTPSEASRLLSTGADGVYGNYLRYWSAWPQASALRRMLYADQKTYLVELLMKQDQMSMACSIESRVPFLDHTFVEFAMSVPDRLKIRRGRQKDVLKRAVEDLLPRDIVYRKKMGFPTPLRKWLSDDASGALLANLSRPHGFLAEYLDVAEIGRLIANHQAGIEDATDRIWRLLNLQLWGEIFFQGQPRAGLAGAV